MDLGRALIDELAIEPPACVALVGAGGKTTLMRALHAEGGRRGWRVVAGTTTKVGRAQVADLEGFVHGGGEGETAEEGHGTPGMAAQNRVHPALRSTFVTAGEQCSQNAACPFPDPYITQSDSAWSADES